LSKLNSRWVRDRSNEEVQYVKRTLAGSRSFIEELRNVLKNLDAEIRNDKEGRPEYADASWPYRQAHLNGELSLIDRIVNEILPDETTLDQLSKELKK
jgi:hypothetical protein